MEADMQREYGIDLMAELPRLSFRRFLVLVRGLGPNSATVARLRSRHFIGAGPRAEVVRESRSPQESENVMASFFGRPASRVS